MFFHISDASGGLPPARLFGLPPLREDPQAQLLHISARGVKHLQEEEKAKEKEEVKKCRRYSRINTEARLFKSRHKLCSTKKKEKIETRRERIFTFCRRDVAFCAAALDAAPMRSRHVACLLFLLSRLCVGEAEGRGEGSGGGDRYILVDTGGEGGGAQNLLLSLLKSRGKLNGQGIFFSGTH